ncbi:thioesterase [Paenibacillus sp. CCS19]|uniref:thioesterase II family protein n=1 Tax=Paenibacillus sp. CCS19 TaxID=3158387 RepID=UPI002569C311|nr:thioesterase domain-containing protein [Paenibacillus cellulosilyticus]GMK39952.1 thioesterase [Paenibacillus cellulosilyticus]
MENKWVSSSYLPKPDAKAILFCLPFAGGSASFYKRWSALLPDIDVVAIQLPGRDERLFEQPFLHVHNLIESLAPQILPMLERPFSFMGYSMGGIIAYELAYYLQNLHGLYSEHLFIGACRSPHSNGWLSLPRSYSDDDIMTKLRDLGGTPKEILEQPELLNIILPTIRADFMLCSNYKPRVNFLKLRSSIHVFGGMQDATVSDQDAAQWAAHTDNRFAYKPYEGGHFFIHDYLSDIVQSIHVSMLANAQNDLNRRREFTF